MTRRAAIEILILNAARNVAGVGQGIRSLNECDRLQVIEAIQKVWPYNFPCDNNALSNLGLSR